VIIKDRKTFTLLIFIVFAIFMVALKTPMHSDDYSYYSRGLSIETHIANYMHWSGRVVADYISTFMLFFDDINIRAIINSIGVASLITLIAAMPSAFTGKALRPDVLALVFFLYWIANPNIGQTSFWIVGTANYTFTTLLAFCYIYFLIKWYKNHNPIKILVLFFLGILAGCSNENTSVTMAGLSLLATCYLVFGKVTNIKYAVIPTIGVILGAAIILLAPGNYVRAKHPLFIDFGKLSVFEKIHLHLSDRILFAFTSAWPVFLVAAVLITCFFVKKIYKQNINSLILIAISAFFFMGFIVDNFVLFAAPYTPPRSYSSGFCFLMLSLSFLISACLQKDNKPNKIIISISIIAGAWFIYSYYFIYSSYARTFVQNNIRVSSILANRINGDDIIPVPTLHFAKLLKEEDQFDRYHNDGSIGSFFGINKVPPVTATFDYSGISQKPIATGKFTVIDDTVVTGIYISHQQPMINGTLIFEFNKNSDDIVNWTSKKRMFTHIYLKNGKSITRYFSRLTIPLFNRFYGGVALRGIDENQIQSISFGFEDNGVAKSVYNIKL
jgi:hypothetical protein